jgi:hypothetical protein
LGFLAQPDLVEQTLQANRWKQCCVPVGKSLDPHPAHLEDVPEGSFAVAAEMMESPVVCGKQPRVGRHGDDRGSSGPQYSSDLRDRGPVIPDVLKHVGRHHHIERTFLKRELGTDAAATVCPSARLSQPHGGRVWFYADDTAVQCVC